MTLNEQEQAAGEQQYDCYGPNSMYIKLISNDGHQFIIKREHALVSSTIRAMLNDRGEFGNDEMNFLRFSTISSHILKKVCMFFEHSAKYKDQIHNIEHFAVEPEDAIDILQAANFLNC